MIVENLNLNVLLLVAALLLVAVSYIFTTLLPSSSRRSSASSSAALSAAMASSSSPSSVQVGPCALPEDVRAYRRTDEFTPTTVPRGLLRHHHTRAGVWGLAHVLEGELEYVVYPEASSSQNPADVDAEYVVRKGEAAVIRPQNYHHVRLLTPTTRFYVEFFTRSS